MRLARAVLLGLLALAACDKATPPPAPSPSAPARVVSSASPSARPAPAPSAAPAKAPSEVDAGLLARLLEDAKATRSDALIVISRGRVLVDWSSEPAPRPIQSMSITKSVLALLVGCLLDSGKLTLDRPVHELFPKWSGERQRQVTLLHLLSHASGIEEGDSTRAIYAAKSFLEQALSSPIAHDPGTHYEYGNRASNLLSGLIARAAGEPTEAFAKRCLFEPLGITQLSWTRDRAGMAHGLAGLHLLPRDLAKLGELVLAEGDWHGRRVLSAATIRRITRQPAALQPAHKRLALLWWLLPAFTERTIDASIVAEWRRAQVDAGLIEQLQTLEGRRFRSGLELVGALRTATGDPELARVEREIWKKKLPDARYRFGPIVGSFAQGSLGQFLVVAPEAALVAVRMRRSPRDPAERDDIEQGFPDFPDRVVSLLEPPLYPTGN